MKQCPSCNSENRDTAKFCQICAAALPPAAPEAATYCLFCGGAVSASARFCQHCAAPVQSQVPPASPPASPPSPQPSASPPELRHPADPPAQRTGMLPPSSVVGGRYVVIRRLGKGGMGAVYLVQDNRLTNRFCALKEMSDVAIIDPHEKQQAEEAFRQEALLLSDLNHPHLPRVTDFFKDSDKLYLVMDFVEGRTLDDLMDGCSTPFPEGQVVDWGVQLCDVLGYLHAHQPPIVFRDLKPGNIMVSPDGAKVKLIDFGIARLFKPGVSKDTQLLGTPGYAPPEQYGHGQSDPRSDVYALGAVLHHLLTLRHPADDPFKFPSLRALNPGVSLRVEQAILKAVAQDAAHRWQTISELRQALCGAPQPPGLHPAGPAQPVPPKPVAQTIVAPYQPVPAPASFTPPPPGLANYSAAPPENAAAYPPYPGSQPQNPLAQPQAYPPGGPHAQSFPYPVPVPYGPPVPLARPAGLFRRFFAFLLDNIFVGMLVSGLAALIIYWIENDSSSFYHLIPDDDYINIGLLVVIILYYALPHARSGKTLGKRICGIKVARQDGSRVGFIRALWRTFVHFGVPVFLTGLISAIAGWDGPYPVGFILYLLPLIQRQRRGFHDLLSGTWVIQD